MNKPTTVQGLVELSPEAIKQAAPQVYTQAPYSGTSSRYSFVPTYQVVEDMNKLGWKVCQATTMKTNSSIQRSYGKHMVRFFNPDVFISDGQGGVEAYPQILVINNHRGWGKFQFEIGIFRLVCSNGLVVKDKDMGSFVFRHLGYSFEELKELVNKALTALPLIVQKINVLSGLEMTEKQQREFAKQALRLRLGEERVITDTSILGVLEPDRDQDKGNTVWKVFNRVQERIVKGGFEAETEKGTTRKVRAITNMLKDVEVNQRLWELVEGFV